MILEHVRSRTHKLCVHILVWLLTFTSHSLSINDKDLVCISEEVHTLLGTPFVRMPTLQRCCLPGGVGRSEGVRYTTVQFSLIYSKTDIFLSRWLTFSALLDRVKRLPSNSKCNQCAPWLQRRASSVVRKYARCVEVCVREFVAVGRVTAELVLFFRF